MTRLRVAVIDDHAVFAEALAALLAAEADIDVAGVATTASAGDRLVRASAPVLAAIDVDLADEDGLELVARWRHDGVDCRVIVVTAYDDAATAVAAVRAGANGLIGKGADTAELVHAMRQLADGGSWVPPSLLTPVLDQLRSNGGASAAGAGAPGGGGRVGERRRVASLSERERQVLACLSSGLSRDSIAERLVLSRNTVRTHVQAILSKLGVHSSLEAVTIAARVGLSFDEDPT